MVRLQETARSILIVEDDGPLRMLMETLLVRAGFAVESVEDGAAAVSVLAHRKVDAIVLDLMLPISSGFDVLKVLATSSPDMLQRTIVTTALAERQLSRFDSSIVFALIRKPFDIDLFVDKVRDCVQGDGRERSRQRRTRTTSGNPGAEDDRSAVQRRSLERFVSTAPVLREALRRPPGSNEELLLRAELRSRITELSDVLEEASNAEPDDARAATMKRTSRIARELANGSPTSQQEH